MSDNNNNLGTNSGQYVVVSQTIPTFVGQYSKGNEKTPQIVIIDIDCQQLTKLEKRVCDFFKCTVNWNQNSHKESVDKTCSEKQKCFATRQTILNFETHLNGKHSSMDHFFCVYCYEWLSDKSSVKTYPIRYLIKHMLKRHRFRRFQCNLCLYRAITEEHLIVHQKTTHPSEYLKAVCDNSSQSSDERICKIFVCPKVTEENRNLLFYWNKYTEKRLNSEGKNETYFQCLYCSFMDEFLSKVTQHCVERHPDFPLLYYIPEPKVSSSTAIENHDFPNYDTKPDVQPKLEPQDNIVSSTQKSPETEIYSTNDINSTSDLKRRLSTEEDNRNNAKRIRVDSSDERVRQNNPNQNVIIEELNVQKKTICLFCEQTFDVQSDEATAHLKSHFENPENDIFVTKWILLFVSKQWTLSSFTNFDTSKSKNVYYYCPLCVKLAKIHNKFAKNYKTFSEVRRHLLCHIWWLSVKCKLCLSSISNCDPIITEHFNDNRCISHYSALRRRKFQFLLTTESDVSFSAEQRSELEKKYIEVIHNSVIDPFINQMLIKIKEEFEKQLLKTCKTPDMLWVKVDRLDKSDHNYSKYLKEYEEDKQRKEMKKNQSKKSSKSKETSGHKNSPIGDEFRERVDKPRDLLEDLNIMRDSLQEGPQTSSTCATTSNGIVSRNRLASSESRDKEANRDSDTDDSIVEEFARISCYHCNDKFKTKREFKDHSKRKHPNLPQRMYAKPRKTNNPFIQF